MEIDVGGGVTMVAGIDAPVGRWVGKILDVDDWGYYTAVGAMLDGKPIAGFVFNNYHPPDARRPVAQIEISMAATNPRWFRVKLVRAIFEYVFVRLECDRFMASADASNQSWLTFLERLGFKQEGRLRKAGSDGSDIILFGMLKSECRWIDQEHVNKKAAKTPRSVRNRTRPKRGKHSRRPRKRATQSDQPSHAVR